MKLRAWARERGVPYRAAPNWFYAGALPVPARPLSASRRAAAGVRAAQAEPKDAP